MANTYLSRTQGTGNRQKFTYSAWIKRGALAEGFLFQGYTSTSSFVHIKFDGNNKLQVFGKTGGSDQMDLVTSRVFRDTGAFYHVIVAIDTTQSTDTNRVKVYINGVQETSFSTTSYPSVNAIALSDEPTTVNTVPEKLPATVPNEPAAVVNEGAVLAVIILFVDLPALPSGFSILT